MMEALDQARKFKLPICLAGQYLGQFKTDEFDMTPSILNNCGNMICFQKKHPDDLKIWKEYFGYANLSFEKHFQVTDRPDGYDFVQIDDSSESKGVTRSKSRGGSETETKGVSRSVNESVSRQTGVTQSRNRQTGVSCSDSEAISKGGAGGGSITESPIIVNGEIIAHTQVASRNHSENSSLQKSSGRSSSEASGEGEARSESVTNSTGTSDSTSRAKSKGENWSDSVGESESETISHKTVPLARTREFVYESPQLQDSVDDQFHKFAHVQRTLAQRHATVSVVGTGESFVIKVGKVEDVFEKAEFERKVEQMKQKIYKTHPYYSVPALSPEAQDKQLDDFLAIALSTEWATETRKREMQEEPEKSPFDQ